MESKAIQPDRSISLFVKNILVLEDDCKDQKTILPFFADGYPGLMFQQSTDGLYVMPYNIEMSSFFLYGQTIKPIELVIEGTYTLVVFQLYPFVLHSLFNINAKDINDKCYDLEDFIKAGATNQQLAKPISNKKRIEIITAFLVELFNTKKVALDLQIRQALEIIIEHQGQVSVKDICKKIHLTERTFERRFLKEAGISAKQFSKMIQFQQSLQQITLKEYNKLTDLVYENGFADQSHFIRVFKAFTGTTPKKFVVK